jgi:hypothetical protein
MPSNTEKAAVVFPPLPNKDKQPWIKELRPSERAKEDKQREDGIIRDTGLLADVIKKYPGFEEVDEESIKHLAEFWAVTVADTYDEGTQSGILNEADRVRRSRQGSSASFHAQEAVPMTPGSYAGGR